MTVNSDYTTWVARIRNLGAFHMPLADVPGELATFRRELRRAVKAAGMRLQTSAQNGWFLAWDPDHVVSEERKRAVADATQIMSGPPPASG